MTQCANAMDSNQIWHEWTTRQTGVVELVGGIVQMQALICKIQRLQQELLQESLHKQ